MATIRHHRAPRAQKAAGEPWPKEKADRVASAAWYVVGKIRSDRK